MHRGVFMMKQEHVETGQKQTVGTNLYKSLLCAAVFRFQFIHSLELKKQKQKCPHNSSFHSSNIERNI